MATIAVKMVLEKLAILLSEEAQLLGGLRGGVDQLHDDLESMRSFLLDAEARSESDEGIKTWVKQVRDVAYDTEDVLAEFLLRLCTPQGHGFFHAIRKGFRYIHQLRTRHRLATQIHNIKERVKAISDRRNAFSFQRTNEATSSNAIQTWHDPRMASLFIDEADVVGIENPKCSLINWLVGELQNLTTVSVVGMGGLGKTTLVKKTYDSHQLKKYFECRAWITVSKSFTAVELLQAALKSFLESAKEPVPEAIDMMGHVQLLNELKDYLQHKRYVVVLDDVWGINAWESVKFAFPDCNCKSRIIFTTRTIDVAVAVETPVHVYELQPLPENVAWTLFCAKAFRGAENKGVCPEELQDMSRSILKKCGGLPMAIVAIGGLLSKKNKLVLEWKKLHDSLGSEMKSNSNLQSTEKILMLSYKDLPYHLKCCFLYLSVFPEDYLIKRTKLIRLWVIERFVEEKAGFTMEEVAEDYLNELVSRSMIQVVQMNFSNRLVTCRVHDLMREITQSKAMDESLVVILNERSLTLNEKVHRIALHDHCKDFPSAMKFPKLRSLLLFGSMGSSISSVKGFCYGFRLLRLLELEGVPLSEFPVELTGMIHLRYLSLRRTNIRELPESIGKLKSLEILDLKHSLISSIPDGILHLEHLRQLRNYRYRLESPTIFLNSYGMRVPDGIGKLAQLEKLGSIEVSGNGHVVRELGRLTQLRRLSILQMRQDDGIHLCSSLEKMKQLTSLFMVSITPSEFVPLDSLSSPPQFLQHLYLKCNLPILPKWIESLRYLAKLVLQYCNLSSDPLKMLQGLPNLVVLELREAYGGEELWCDARGGYPRLKNLSLYRLKQLKCMRVEEGAMSGLRELEIMSCEKLEKVPLGIEHLGDLQELVVWGMPPVFYEKIEPSQGEDFWKVQHIPIIKDFY